MLPSLLLPALMSIITTVSALPTSAASQSCIQTCDTSPLVGATIFKSQNPRTCGSVATDYNTIPLDTRCFNLSNLFGVWEGETRSLVVSKGVKCEFYTTNDCPKTSTPLCLGSKTNTVQKMTLKEFDRKIYSARCAKL